MPRRARLDLFAIRAAYRRRLSVRQRNTLEDVSLPTVDLVDDGLSD